METRYDASQLCPTTERSINFEWAGDKIDP